MRKMEMAPFLHQTTRILGCLPQKNAKSAKKSKFLAAVFVIFAFFCGKSDGVMNPPLRASAPPRRRAKNPAGAKGDAAVFSRGDAQARRWWLSIYVIG